MLTFDNVRYSVETLYDKYSVHSSPRPAMEDTIFKSLVKEGEYVVPYLILLIDDYPHQVFNLILEIVGPKETIVQEKNRGVVQAMILDFKKWFRERKS